MYSFRSHCIMCCWMISTIFCCPCMFVYWIVANIFSLLKSLICRIFYIGSCNSEYDIEETVDIHEYTPYNPGSPLQSWIPTLANPERSFCPLLCRLLPTHHPGSLFRVFLS